MGRGDLREGGQGVLQMLARTQEELQPEQEMKAMAIDDSNRIKIWAPYFVTYLR